MAAAGPVAHVALGGNLDDPVASLLAAVAALGRLGRITAVSSLWVTAPVGGPADQPAYRNAVALWRPAPPWARPDAALAALAAIEAALGRRLSPRWAPRTIDLDLLDWDAGAGDAVAAERGHALLRAAWPELPHPRAFDRPFVLVPWAEVAPGRRPSGATETVGERRARVGADGVERVEAWERERWRGAVAAPLPPAAGTRPR